METSFKTPIAMKVTLQQYLKDLKYQLLGMGYKWLSSNDEIELDRDYPYLKTNYNNESNGLGGASSRFCNYDIKIENYNPELFLAIAAMTHGDDWVVGEWFYCHTNLVMDSNGRIEAYAGKLYKSEKKECITDESGDKSHFFTKKLDGSSYKIWFRKATVKELEYHFMKKRIVRYDSKPEYEKALNRLTGRGNYSFVPGSCSYDEAVTLNILDIMFTPVYGEDEKILNVGNFQIKVKDGRAYHKNENITNFVEGLISHYTIDRTMSSYKVSVKDVIFSRTGCEHGESKLSEWLEVYKLLK